MVALKNIKDETFIKEIRVQVDVKTNFLMRTLKNYQFLAFSSLFWLVFGSVMAFYAIIFTAVVIIQILNFISYVKVKHWKIIKTRHRKRTIPRIVSVWFPITKDV